MNKSFERHFRTMNFCHPVSAENGCFTTACIMQDASKNLADFFVAGNSIYVPLVRLTDERMKFPVKPDDVFTAGEVEKYSGIAPEGVKISTVVLSGGKYVKSIGFAHYTAGDEFSKQPVNLGSPVQNDPQSGNNELHDSLVVEIQTTDAPVNGENLILFISVLDDSGYQSSVYLDFMIYDRQSKQSNVVGGNIKRYTTSYDYINDYNHFMVNFKVTPNAMFNVEGINDPLELNQYLWQYVFSFRLKRILKHLQSYTNKEEKEPVEQAEKSTIYEYIHQIPDTGIKFDPTFKQLFDEAKSCLERIKKAPNAEDHAKALKNLNEILKTLESLSKQTHANSRLINRFNKETTQDHEFLEDFKAFLQQYCNLMLQLCNTIFMPDKSRYLKAMTPVYNDIVTILYQKGTISGNIYLLAPQVSDQVLGIFYDILNGKGDDFEKDIYNLAKRALEFFNVDTALEGVILAFVGAISKSLYQKAMDSKFHKIIVELAKDTRNAYIDVNPCLVDYNSAEHYARIALGGLNTFVDLWGKTQSFIDQTKDNTVEIIKNVELKNYSNTDAQMELLAKQWNELYGSYFKGICLDY